MGWWPWSHHGVRRLSAIHTEHRAQGEWGGQGSHWKAHGPWDTLVLPCSASSVWQLRGLGVVHGSAAAS